MAQRGISTGTLTIETDAGTLKVVTKGMKPGYLTRLAARRVGEMHPLVVGGAEYQKLLDVMEGCSRIALARRGL